MHVVEPARPLRKQGDTMSRPKRLSNRSYVGRFLYLLTFCALDRRPVFEDKAAASETQDQIQRTAADQGFAVLAYCVMPDHVHLLVRALDETSDLRRFVKTLKERTGRAHRIRAGGRLWQEGYFERVLRDEADVRRCAIYIVNNPVRAGLVTNAAEYEFVGSAEWTIDDLTKLDSNDRAVSRS